MPEEMMIVAKDKKQPTREQYEQLIALLEESNDIQDKTIQVLKQQVEVLQDMLTAAERKLRERELNTSIPVFL